MAYNRACVRGERERTTSVQFSNESGLTHREQLPKPSSIMFSKGICFKGEIISESTRANLSSEGQIVLTCFLHNVLSHWLPTVNMTENNGSRECLQDV
jgi:hypothetical protein